MKIMNFTVFFLVCLLKMVCYTMLICAAAGAVCHVRLAAWQVIDPHFIAGGSFAMRLQKTARIVTYFRPSFNREVEPQYGTNTALPQLPLPLLPLLEPPSLFILIFWVVQTSGAPKRPM
jgi:hypothetical protein